MRKNPSKPTRKLTLTREVLRAIANNTLGKVAGGVTGTCVSRDCTTTCSADTYFDGC